MAKFWQFWVGKFSHLPSVTVRHLSVEFCNIGYIGWRESKNYTHKESIERIFIGVWHILDLSHLPLNASRDDLQKRLLNEHPQWEQSRLNLGVWRTKLIKAATDLSNFGNSCHIRGILCRQGSLTSSLWEVSNDNSERLKRNMNIWFHAKKRRMEEAV